MSTTTTICVHSPFFDIDEWRCRLCSRSLTYAPRSPGTAEKRDRENGHPEALVTGIDPRTPIVYTSCLKCRDHGVVQQVRGKVRCFGCGAVLLAVNANGRHSLPPFTPPRLLECTCCRELLPQFCFSRNARAAHRERRNAMCRGCLAFRERVKREERPETVRAIDRQRQATWRAGLTPEQRKAKAPSKAAVNAAGQRYRARQNGRGVLKQRAGRQPILVKPICRVAAVCPLRDYCTTEGKGLA